MSYALPPRFSGTAESQAGQIYSFLFQLVEALNVAETAVNQATVKKIEEAVSLSGGNMPTGDTIEEVKALINKTAKDFNDIALGLGESVENLESDFGEYESTITSTIEETAAAMITRYGFQASISALEEQAAGFAMYQMETEGFIKQGFVETDNNGIPIIGIAIGQGLTSQKVTIDGTEYERLDSAQSCAFYTASRVSFRVNGKEAAYVSNRKLYIGDVEITGDIVLAGKWLLSTAGGGLSIKWIGE